MGALSIICWGHTRRPNRFKRASEIQFQGQRAQLNQNPVPECAKVSPLHYGRSRGPGQQWAHAEKHVFLCFLAIFIQIQSWAAKRSVGLSWALWVVRASCSSTLSLLLSFLCVSFASTISVLELKASLKYYVLANSGREGCRAQVDNTIPDSSSLLTQFIISF